MSVDPLIHGGSQGINPYSYMMNNPLSGVDPTGYEPEKETIEVDAHSQVYEDADGNNYVSAGDGSGDLIKIDSISGKNSNGDNVSISYGDNGKMKSYAASNSSGTLSVTDIRSENQKTSFVAVNVNQSEWADQNGNPQQEPEIFNGTETASTGNGANTEGAMEIPMLTSKQRVVLLRQNSVSEKDLMAAIKFITYGNLDELRSLLGLRGDLRAVIEINQIIKLMGNDTLGFAAIRAQSLIFDVGSSVLIPSSMTKKLIDA